MLTLTFADAAVLSVMFDVRAPDAGAGNAQVPGMPGMPDMPDMPDMPGMQH